MKAILFIGLVSVSLFAGETLHTVSSDHAQGAGRRLLPGEKLDRPPAHKSVDEVTDWIFALKPGRPGGEIATRPPFAPEEKEKAKKAEFFLLKDLIDENVNDLAGGVDRETESQ